MSCHPFQSQDLLDPFPIPYRTWRIALVSLILSYPVYALEEYCMLMMGQFARLVQKPLSQSSGMIPNQSDITITSICKALVDSSLNQVNPFPLIFRQRKDTERFLSIDTWECFPGQQWFTLEKLFVNSAHHFTLITIQILWSLSQGIENISLLNAFLLWMFLF